MNMNQNLKAQSIKKLLSEQHERKKDIQNTLVEIELKSQEHKAEIV